MSKLDLTVVVISFNEEQNLPYLLDNVKDIAKEVVIVDSGSTDNTVKLAEDYGARVYYRKFDNFSSQRNYALKELEYNTEWLYVLDADEIFTEELKDELRELLPSNPTEDAFFIKRRFYWMGKWVKRGYYPVWLMRLGRAGKMVCDDRGINEHMICLTDNVGRLESDFIDENHKGITDWVNKHNRYADFEALRLIEDTNENYSFWKSQYERKRWIRVNIWNKLPMFSRPFLLLFYRLFIQLAIFDGGRVILYHCLHAFFYRFLIDAKLLEYKISQKKQ